MQIDCREELLTRVLNKHRDTIPIGSVYIGRGSIWGNPYVIGRDGTRDDVCNKYEIYLLTRIENGEISLNQLADLAGKNLVCFCAPLRCHGDFLVKLAKLSKAILDDF